MFIFNNDPALKISYKGLFDWDVARDLFGLRLSDAMPDTFNFCGNFIWEH